MSDFIKIVQVIAIVTCFSVTHVRVLPAIS